jgi:hypothetical protein
LNNTDILLFARTNYLGPRSEVSFVRDMATLRILQKQITRYYKKRLINYRLFLNNIILFFNVFSIRDGKFILFNYIDSDYHYVLKTFLTFLDYMEEFELPNVEISTELLLGIKQNIYEST